MKTTIKIDVQTIEFAAKTVRVMTLPARAQIIKLLDENEKLNVTQIYSKLNMEQSETSIHLGLLKKYGILKKVRSGKMSIYSLNRDLLDRIIRISEELSKS